MLRSRRKSIPDLALGGADIFRSAEPPSPFPRNPSIRRTKENVHLSGWASRRASSRLGRIHPAKCLPERFPRRAPFDCEPINVRPACYTFFRERFRPEYIVNAIIFSLTRGTCFEFYGQETIARKSDRVHLEGDD